MIHETAHPIPCEITKIELRKTIPSDDGQVLLDLRLRVDLPLDVEDVDDLLGTEEAEAVRQLLQSAARSKGDKKPHTYGIKVKRAFEAAEYVFSRGTKEEVIPIIVETKNTPGVKGVGDELKMTLTLDGMLDLKLIEPLAKWSGSRVTLVVNPLQNVVPLAS